MDKVSNNPAYDHLAALAALGLYLGLHFSGLHALSFTDWGSVTSFHQTLVEVAAGLFAIVFAAVAILRGFGGGRRIDHLQSRLARPLTNNLKAVIRALGIATAVTIVAMPLDSPSGHSTVARAATVWVVALAGVRMVRLIWVFSLVLDLGDRDVESRDRQALNPTHRPSQRAGRSERARVPLPGAGR